MGIRKFTFVTKTEFLSLRLEGSNRHIVRTLSFFLSQIQISCVIFQIMVIGRFKVELIFKKEDGLKYTGLPTNAT